MDLHPNWRFIKQWILLCLIGGLTACSSLSGSLSSGSLTSGVKPELDSGTPLSLASVLQGSALQEKLDNRAKQPLDWSLPDDKVMSLNQDMQDFLNVYVPRQGSSTNKLQALLNAVMHNGLLGLDYNPQATYSASDAFFYREANCLSFSLMFIAMAREVGLHARFNQVSIPPSWDMLNQQILVNYKHINAKVKVRGGHQIVDLNIKDYKTHYRQRIVSDDQAQAQYYNNRAMDYLSLSDTRNAYRYIRKAIDLAPDLGYLWGNFATVYRREGLWAEAEIAYRQAIALEPNNYVAASNLSRLYQQQGKHKLANHYREQTEKFRQRNPYYRFLLAEQALKNNDLRQAREHINFALKHAKHESRIQALGEQISQAENAQLVATELH